MPVALTSRIAYKRVNGTKKPLTQQQLVVVAMYRSGNKGLTRNELVEVTGMRLSSVTGRVNELIKKGILEDSLTPKRKCNVTQELGKVVKLTVKAHSAVTVKLSA